MDIKKEFDEFMEFPSDSKEYVTSISAKLFAEYCVDKTIKELQKDQYSEYDFNVDNFKLIYQGGQHNVYCDGTYHIKTIGGFCGIGGDIDKNNEITKVLDRFKNVYKAEPMRCSCYKSSYLEIKK